MSRIDPHCSRERSGLAEVAPIQLTGVSGRPVFCPTQLSGQIVAARLARSQCVLCSTACGVLLKRQVRQPAGMAALPSTARRGLRVIQTAGCESERSGCVGRVERGDHVLCRGHGGPHVGTVVGQRRAATGERYLMCRWYYRPEESEAGRQPFDSNSELLESDHVDIVPQSAVFSRCRVLPPDEFAREREVQIAAIRSARMTEYFEQHPVTGESRAAAEPWGKTFGASPTPEEVELLDVMHRLLRLVQSEVRPDECRRPLQNWLGTSRAPKLQKAVSDVNSPISVSAGPPNAALDREEFPAQPGSKTAKSRASTL